MRTLLKPTGSIYLHCDITASHYIKILWMPYLDTKTLGMRLYGITEDGQVKKKISISV